MSVGHNDIEITLSTVLKLVAVDGHFFASRHAMGDDRSYVTVVTEGARFRDPSLSRPKDSFQRQDYHVLLAAWVSCAMVTMRQL